jgi:hypothetical protein
MTRIIVKLSIVKIETNDVKLLASLDNTRALTERTGEEELCRIQVSRPTLRTR